MQESLARKIYVEEVAAYLELLRRWRVVIERIHNEYLDAVRELDRIALNKINADMRTIDSKIRELEKQLL